MGAAPLNWLAKIGGDTLKTKAKLLSSAINELYDDGQCKIVAVVDNTADNGKTVLITTDDNKTYSGTIANKKCEFLLPPKTLYTVQKVSSGSAEFTTKVEAGYGDCILVHLDTGYVEVKQGDIVGLDYIKAATADDLKNKVPEANAVKELNGKLNNRIATVIGPTDASGVGTVIYPNGFNINNCVIISCELIYRANEIYSFPYDNNQAIQYVQKNYSGVTIYVYSGSFADCKFSVTFLKLS